MYFVNSLDFKFFWPIFLKSVFSNFKKKTFEEKTGSKKRISKALETDFQNFYFRRVYFLKIFNKINTFGNFIAFRFYQNNIFFYANKIFRNYLILKSVRNNIFNCLKFREEFFLANLN